MATFTSIQSGPWSSGTTWGSGVYPGDNDTVIINSGHAVMFDIDMTSPSVYATGINTLTITGAGPGGIPGKLYFPSNSGVRYLKIKSGTNLQGTNHVNYGELVANSGGTINDNTPMPYDSKSTVEFLGTAAGYIDAQYLNIKTVCTNPTTKYVETYGYCYDAVYNSGTGYWSLYNNWDIPANGSPVYLSVDNSGVLPSGYSINTKYFVRDRAGVTCKLSDTYNGTAITPLQSSVSGVYLHHGKYEVVSISGSYFILDGAFDTQAFNIVRLKSSTLPSGLLPYDTLCSINASSKNIQLTYCQNQIATLFTPVDSGVGQLYLYGGLNNLPNTNRCYNTVEDVSTDPKWQINSDIMFCSSVGNSSGGGKILYKNNKFLRTDISLGLSAFGPGSLMVLADRNVAIKTNANNFGSLIFYPHSGCNFDNQFYSTGGYCDYLKNGNNYRVNGGILCRSGNSIATGTSTTNISGVFNDVIIAGNANTIYTGSYNKIKNSLITGSAWVLQSNTYSTIDDNSIVCGQAGVIGGSVYCVASGIFHGLAQGVFGATSHCEAYGIVRYSDYLDYSSTYYSKYNCDIRGIRTECFVGQNAIFSGSIKYCAYVFGASSISNTLCNTVLLNNICDIRSIKNNTGYAVSSSGVFVANNYKYGDVTSYLPYNRTMFYDSPSPGHIACYNFGGNTQSQTYSAGTHGTPPITPPTCVHNTLTENLATTPPYVKHMVEIPLWCTKDQSMTVKVYAKQVTTGFDERAKFDLINNSVYDGNNGEILATATIEDNTDWQTLTLTAPARSAEGPLILRLTVRGVNKRLYWFQNVEPANIINNTYFLI